MKFTFKKELDQGLPFNLFISLKEGSEINIPGLKFFLLLDIKNINLGSYYTCRKVGQHVQVSV